MWGKRSRQWAVGSGQWAVGSGQWGRSLGARAARLLDSIGDLLAMAETRGDDEAGGPPALPVAGDSWAMAGTRSQGRAHSRF